MMRIIVCDEKHGTTYWRADTPEQWAASSLAILSERWRAGGWYHDPANDGLGNSEWAARTREERAKALMMTDEQIAALPVSAAGEIRRLRREARQARDADREQRAWYVNAKQVVESQDRGMFTVSKGTRWERQVPKAWTLLDDRSDHEYEQVELAPLRAAVDVAALRHVSNVLGDEATRQLHASVINAAEAAVAEYNAEHHAGRTERDEAMAERIADLATALTVLDAHTRSQVAQTP